MVLLFASPSLDAVSNALGLRWRPVRRLHATVAVMASLLLVFHVICIQVDRRPFPLEKPENLWGLVVSDHIRGRLRCMLTDWIQVSVIIGGSCPPIRPAL